MYDLIILEEGEVACSFNLNSKGVVLAMGGDCDGMPGLFIQGKNQEFIIYGKEPMNFRYSLMPLTADKVVEVYEANGGDILDARKSSSNAL